jgi:hypothetical protein
MSAPPALSQPFCAPHHAPDFPHMPERNIPAIAAAERGLVGTAPTERAKPEPEPND